MRTKPSCAHGDWPSRNCFSSLLQLAGSLLFQNSFRAARRARHAGNIVAACNHCLRVRVTNSILPPQQQFTIVSPPTDWILQFKRLACPSAVVPESLVSTSNRVFSSETKGGRCDRVRRSVVHLS